MEGLAVVSRIANATHSRSGEKEAIHVSPAMHSARATDARRRMPSSFSACCATCQVSDATAPMIPPADER